MWRPLFVLALILGVATSCGDAPSGDVPPEDPAPPTGGEPDPQTAMDPGDTNAPEDVSWALTQLREQASSAGVFDDLPPARNSKAPRLYKAFKAARALAAAHAGETVGGAAGENYVPSSEELRLAELGDRIRRVLPEPFVGPADEVRERLEAAGVETQTITYTTFVERAVVVAGTGYVTIVEPRQQTCILPSQRLIDEAEIKSMKIRSTSNMKMMLILMMSRAGEKGWPKFSGKKFLLSLVANGLIEARNYGNLKVYFSPGDDALGLDKIDPARFHRDVTRATLQAGGDFSEFTSYAGRRNADPDYALTPDMLREGVPVIADVSFEDCVLIAFSDGTVKEMTRDDLGLAPDDPMEVGDDAASEMLRGLSLD